MLKKLGEYELIEVGAERCKDVLACEPNDERPPLACLERGKPKNQNEVCLQVSKLVRRALGAGGRGHHGRVNHSFRGVLDGNYAITINHAVLTNHVTSLPRG